MKILIDLQGAQSDSRFCGIGRYALSIALALARNPRGHELSLLLNGCLRESLLDIRRQFHGLIPPERIRTFFVPTPAAEQVGANAWRARAAEIAREQCVAEIAPDLLLVTSLFEGYSSDAAVSIGVSGRSCRTAVILYDLIPLLNPAQYLGGPQQRAQYFRKIESLKKADLLLAISDYTREEAITALGFDAAHVCSISTAVGDRFRPPSSPTGRSQLARHGIARKAVLYAPGGFDARKNFDGLIDAYALLPVDLRASHQLVIASKAGAMERELLDGLRARAGLKPDELVLTGYVSDEELVALYQSARLFVFPSKQEGFGLPALEAMACGAPTIGSDATSVPEVIGDPRALFDPDSPVAIARAMESVLRDEKLSHELAERGLARARQFSWSASARRALEVIDTAFMNHRAEPAAPLPDWVALASSIGLPEPPTDQDLLALSRSFVFNAGPSRMPTLWLDVSVIVHADAKSGIQRVVRSLLAQLLERPPHGFRVQPVYFDGKNYRAANGYLRAMRSGCASAHNDHLIEVCQDDIYLALDLSHHLTQAVHGLQLWWRGLGVRIFYVVYDILPATHPEWWPHGTGSVFRVWLQNIAEVADGLICISDAVAHELRQWLAEGGHGRFDGPAVSSFRLGADISASAPSTGFPLEREETLAALHGKINFLMIGTLEPRKGHAQALEAFELLWKQGVDANLVIVGKEGWLVDHVIRKMKSHRLRNQKLFWLGQVSDEYLEEIYAASTCLLAPSEGEGFGLPLIEAARHRLPILARDLPVFREVARDGAIYFSGSHPRQLAEAAASWIALHHEGRVPSSASIGSITWRQSAAELLERIAGRFENPGNMHEYPITESSNAR
jgi:glycosyltransferase involved in cell wall biosynthesis